jgi:hypothetical protein
VATINCEISTELKEVMAYHWVKVDQKIFAFNKDFTAIEVDLDARTLFEVRFTRDSK